jgi:hypothetical protein
MALETAKQIVERFDLLKGRRKSFESSWQDVADSILGLRSFNETHEPGRQRMRRIYDTTGLLAGHLLAGSLHGIVTNPAGRWFSLDVNPKGLRQDPEIDYWLTSAEASLDILYKAPEYMFPQSAQEFYVDYVFFGTAINYIEDEPGLGPTHHSRPLGECHIDESSEDRADTVFRLYKMSLRKFQQAFGEGVDQEIDRKAKANPTEEVECIHLTHPRSELKTGKARQDERPWRSVYILKAKEKIVRESGYWSFPWQIARWGRDSGEMYGRGPAWMALSDCKMLNEMGKVLISQSQKLMAPPLLVPDDGVLTQIDTSPDSLNIYRAGVFKDDPIRQLPVSDKTLIGEKIVSQRQEMVERAFFGHLLQLFDGTPMTATQTLEMETKAARILVSTLARAAAEWAEPNLRRTMDVAERGGLLLPRPPQMEDVPITITYLSPVMRSQRQQESRAILNTWAAANQIAPASPEVLDLLDADISIRKIAEAEGVPPEILVNDVMVAQMRQMRAQQQEQQQMMEKMSQATEAAGNILPGAAQYIKATQPPPGGPLT